MVEASLWELVQDLYNKHDSEKQRALKEHKEGRDKMYNMGMAQAHNEAKYHMGLILDRLKQEDRQ
jgi:hypothetical protein